MRWHSRATIVIGTLAAVLALACGAAVAASAAPHATAARHGHEQFVLTSRVAAARKQGLVATGVLTARGHGVLGTMTSGLRTVWLVFSHGSVRMVTTVTREWESVPNPATCKFTEVDHGVYRLRGGNRRYAAAAGSGSFVIKTVGLLKRAHGSCSSQLKWFWQATRTSGSMSW